MDEAPAVVEQGSERPEYQGMTMRDVTFGYGMTLPARLVDVLAHALKILAELLQTAAVDALDTFLDGGHTSGTTDEHHVVDVAHGDAGVVQHTGSKFL